MYPQYTVRHNYTTMSIQRLLESFPFTNKSTRLALEKLNAGHYTPECLTQKIPGAKSPNGLLSVVRLGFIYIYIYIYIHIYMCAGVGACVCARVRIYARARVRVYANACVCSRASAFECQCIRVRVRSSMNVFE